MIERKREERREVSGECWCESEEVCFIVVCLEWRLRDCAFRVVEVIIFGRGAKGVLICSAKRVLLALHLSTYISFSLSKF